MFNVLPGSIADPSLSSIQSTTVYTQIPFQNNSTRLFQRVHGSDQHQMSVVQEIFERILTPLYGPQEKAINQIREGLDRACYLLYENEVPVGVLVFKTVLSNEFADYGITDSIEIKSLFIDNSVNNSGRGLGSSLVDKLKEEVNKLALSHKGIHVTVSETKQESLLFFRKKNFNIVHAWKDRYIKGTIEYLLHCPAKIEQVGKSISRETAGIAGLHLGRESINDPTPELLHVIHNAHFDDIHALKKLSDGTFISGSKDNSIYKWSENGELVRIIQEVEPTQKSDRDWVTALQVLNDNYWVSGLRNGTVNLWKTNGDFVKPINVKLPSRSDHFSHEFNTRRVNCFATGLEKDKPGFFVGFPTMLDEYNLIEGRTEYSTKLHKNDWVYCIHPLDDRSILTVTGCTIELLKKNDSGWYSAEVVLPEGESKRVQRGRNTVRQRPFISSLAPLESSPNQFGLAVFDGSVKIIDIITKQIVNNWSEHAKRVWVVQSLDDHRLASCGEDRTIKIWDTRVSGSIHTIKDHIGQVTSLLKFNEHTLISGTCPRKSITSKKGAEIRFYDSRKF